MTDWLTEMNDCDECAGALAGDRWRAVPQTAWPTERPTAARLTCALAELAELHLSAICEHADITAHQLGAVSLVAMKKSSALTSAEWSEVARLGELLGSKTAATCPHCWLAGDKRPTCQPSVGLRAPNCKCPPTCDCHFTNRMPPSSQREGRLPAIANQAQRVIEMLRLPACGA